MTAGAAPVVVVEDDNRYRRSLELLLATSGDFVLVGSFADPLPMLAAAASSWRLVLMDLELPHLSGIETTRRLKRLAPSVAVVVLTVFEEPATVLDAISAGAEGYLVKGGEPAELLAQLRSVLAGGSPLTPAVARVILGFVRHQEGAEPTAPSRASLTDRERQVLRDLVAGHAYKQVAENLGVSLDTVRSHVRSIYRKLQVHGVAEAVSRAVRERLI